MPPKKEIPQQILDKIKEALQAGDTKTVAALTAEAGISITVNVTLGQQSTNTLHRAVEHNDIAAVLNEIAKGADINAIGSSSGLPMTPLGIAVASGNISITEILLHHPALQLGAIQVNNKTAFHLAATQPAILTLFLEHQKLGKNFHINALDADGNTALTIATHAIGNAQSVKILLQYAGIDINMLSLNGSALHIAAMLDNEPVLDVLLEDRNIAIDNIHQGWTPLYHAISEGNIFSAMKLCAKGASINYKGPKKQNMLHSAAFSGNLDIVQYVLKQMLLDLKKQKPEIDEASAQRHIINEPNEDGVYSLHYATLKESPEVIEFFLQQGIANPNTPTFSTGRTPFIIAALKGHTDLIQKFLSHPEAININWADNDGYTAFHYAAKKGHRDIIKELLRLDNIDLNIKTLSGETALELAANNNIEAFCELLSKTTDIENLEKISSNSLTTPQIKNLSSKKLSEVRASQKISQANAMSSSADFSSNLEELSKLWQDMTQHNIHGIVKKIGIPNKSAQSYADILQKTSIIAEKLPYALLFSVCHSQFQPTEALTAKILHAMHAANISYYPAFGQAVKYIISIGEKVNNFISKPAAARFKKAIQDLQEVHFINDSDAVKIADAKGPLTQLWEQMKKGQYEEISKIFSRDTKYSLKELQNIAINIKDISCKDLPKTLLFAISLKQLALPAASDVIQKVTAMMSKVIQQESTKYTAEIKEILSIPFASSVLTEMARMVLLQEKHHNDQESTFWHIVGGNEYTKIHDLLLQKEDAEKATTSTYSSLDHGDDILAADLEMLAMGEVP